MPDTVAHPDYWFDSHDPSHDMETLPVEELLKNESLINYMDSLFPNC
jgi:hypothetical protein